MRNPPTATAVVRTASPVMAAAAPQATAVVTRCPPGLTPYRKARRMPALPRACSLGPVRPTEHRASRNEAKIAVQNRVLYSRLGSIFRRRFHGIRVRPGGHLRGLDRRFWRGVSCSRATFAAQPAGDREAHELRVRRRADRLRLDPVPGRLLSGRADLHRLRRARRVPGALATGGAAA